MVVVSILKSQIEAAAFSIYFAILVETYFEVLMCFLAEIEYFFFLVELYNFIPIRQDIDDSLQAFRKALQTQIMIGMNLRVVQICEDVSWLRVIVDSVLWILSDLQFK